MKIVEMHGIFIKAFLLLAPHSLSLLLYLYSDFMVSFNFIQFKIKLHKRKSELKWAERQ